jgi:hypothetical protein
MRSVQLEEFSRRPSEYLESGESLSIERDGVRVGYYLPAQNGQVAHAGLAFPRKDTPEAREAMEQFKQVVQDLLDQTGLTEDELADLLDPKKPFPYD